MPDTNVADAPAAVRISPASPQSRRLLRGDPAVLGPAFGVALPLEPCTASDGEPAALWLGPDEWLLLAPETATWPEWVGDEGAAFDVGHRQVGWLVEGAWAETTLACACPLDLALAAFPAGACTRTVLGKAEVVLWRRAAHSFHLEVWRSFAAYVQVLLEASATDTAQLNAG